MKLLIITNYLGNRGGLGRYSFEVVKALESYAIDMKVISEASTPTVPFEHNILRPVFRQKPVRRIWNFILNIYTVRRFAKNVDIIHAHDGWPYGVYGWLAVLGTSKKLFITGIGTYTLAPLQETLMGMLLCRSYRRAEVILCISDYLRSQLKELCPEVVTTTVLMGPPSLPVPNDEQLRNFGLTYKISWRYPIILTVGDIKHRKGQLNTLLALKSLQNIYPHFLYIIIGSDNDQTYVRKIIDFVEMHHLQNNILMISNNYDDLTLACFYQSCHLFALSSNNDGLHIEGFGLALLEAAQFGKPVVGSRNCGIESALKDGYNGLLTAQGNSTDIANKINDILGPNYDTYSLHARDFYSRFSWKRTLEIYIQYFTNSAKK